MRKIISFVKLIFLFFFGNKIQRYHSIHTLLSLISIHFGFRLGNKNLKWYKNKEFLEIYLPFASKDIKKRRIPERKFVLYSLAKSLKNIKGDIVECGVLRGHSSYLMLYANIDNNKNFHGFDSFEGLSNPDINDKIKNSYSFEWKKNDLKTPELIAKKNLELFKDRIHLYKGWIPDRFNEVKNKKFSMVHIDVDLYKPTLDSISFFWDKINKGGVLVCDDYGFETCPGAKKAMDLFFESKNMSVIHLTTGQGLVFKQ
ncbi:TylF/MycF family methyltransferase [Flavobacteriaceae bacterium]|nr:TylF/MycF family methyltransferase [Flavobacteriaceae bacterium]